MADLGAIGGYPPDLAGVYDWYAQDGQYPPAIPGQTAPVPCMGAAFTEGGSILLSQVRVGAYPHAIDTQYAPNLQFTTQVDGVTDSQPVYLMIGGCAVTSLPVDQPTRMYLPPNIPYEFLVRGLGDRRTEAWGPTPMPASARFTLTDTLADGTVSVPYLSSMTFTGAVSPVSWGRSGTVPPGLDFDEGTLSGTPTTAGTYSFCVTLTDGRGIVLYRQVSVTIAP